MPDVIIIGAGLAGLACAKLLRARDVTCVLLEASDGVGGRVRTDVSQGFSLDRGFQVLLTAYPEAQVLLDYSSLHLQPFAPGALIQRNGARHLLADPFRRPTQALPSLLAPIGSWADKLRVGRMRYRVLHSPSQGDSTTLEYLQSQGFSADFIESFFRPFFGGIFLERELRTSCRMAEFVFRMMAFGDTSLPSAGMGAISSQLAIGLDVKLNSRVVAVEDRSVQIESGERLEARAIVIATEGPEAARLTGLPVRASRGVSCLYFAADHAPISEPLLVLNGDSTGPVNNLCVPSNVATAYAPPGAALISVAALGTDPDLIAVREQLASWFGPQVSRWQHLRTYRIAHAQPEPPPRHFPAGFHVCGDHTEASSIQGALLSGRRMAESVIQSL